MEISLDPMKTTQTNKKGGLRTMPFIIANETFEKVASIGLQANMIMYLRNEYHLEVATGVSILFLWGAIANFTLIIGAFLSDSHFGRFRVIALGTVTTLVGMVVLWLTAIIPQARPLYCDRKDVENCASANLAQLVLLVSSFALMSIGAGGIRPCSMAFGADQFDDSKSPNNDRILLSFFNWYYASVGVAVMLSVTIIVYIQDKLGWIVGFGVPVGLMLFSTVMFFLGSSLYVKVSVNKNLFAGFGRVISASWKNRHLPLPPENFNGWYYLKDSKLVQPTDRLRFLNKACIIRNPEKDLTPEGLASQPWSLCTVKQVEELKCLLKVLPIWSTGIFIAATISQHSISLIQASTTNRQLTAHFQIPAGSFIVFSILTLILWVALYDRAIVPVLSRHTKNPRGLTFKQRMGIGLAISCIATSVAALVETKRRNHGTRGETLSAGWLVPQYCLTGLAEAFNAIGQIEFYYSQFPRSMASIAMALFALGMGMGNLVGAVIVRVVNEVSGKNGGVKWLSNDPNMGHYDYYYWVLTFFGVVNLLYYFLCSWFYGSCEESKIWNDEGEGNLDEDDHLGRAKEANKENLAKV